MFNNNQQQGTCSHGEIELKLSSLMQQNQSAEVLNFKYEISQLSIYGQDCVQILNPQNNSYN